VVIQFTSLSATNRSLCIDMISYPYVGVLHLDLLLGGYQPLVLRGFAADSHEGVREGDGLRDENVRLGVSLLCCQRLRWYDGGQSFYIIRC